MRSKELHGRHSEHCQLHGSPKGWPLLRSISWFVFLKPKLTVKVLHIWGFNLWVLSFGWGLLISKPTRGAKNLLGAASEISQDLITFKQCLKEHPWLIFLLHGSGLKNSSSCESKSSFSGLNLSESFSKQTLYTQCVASSLSEGEDLEQQVNATPPHHLQRSKLPNKQKPNRVERTV